MRLKENSPEVFIADEPVVKVSRREIEFLKEKVRHAPRGRVRLCAHASNTDPLHEMLIVLSGHGYIRPHRHFEKSESFHVIEGMADIVLFDEQGGIREVVELGDLASGRKFFYRIAHPWFHTVMIHSELLVIHETTNGPFKQGDAEFATWAPEESDHSGAARFMASLEEQVKNFLRQTKGT